MASSFAGDDKILNYNDVVLRRSDLGILQGPHFINDRVIEFYFSFLSSSIANSAVLLVPPSISFWLSNCSDSVSLREAAAPLELESKELVLFTVNDNSDFGRAEAGTHWSLLVYHRRMNKFVHHDSSFCSINRPFAKRLFESVKGFVGVGSLEFVDGPTPRQENGYDCGLYVMMIARVVCEYFKGGDGDDWFVVLEKRVNAVVVADLRAEVLELILGLMERK